MESVFESSVLTRQPHGDPISGDPCKAWGGQAVRVWLQGDVLQQELSRGLGS